MPIVDSYLARYRNLNSEVMSKYQKLTNALSEVDREVSAIYHEIEKLDLTETCGHAAAVMLQQVLHRRRVIKGELAQLLPLFRALNGQCSKVIQKHREQAAKNDEIRRSLNVTLTIEDIGGIRL
ncbi:hypothetical protein [Paenibacillus pinihumi]|uniref:hypothetical protein n=1 Tax=Paenibacillus pinihumi TaxID=669462 RepID=UPI0004908DF3|nr:hypothetical protein [Paenibacillus pinihumi]